MEQDWHRVYVKSCVPHLCCQLLSIFGPLTWANFSVLAASSIIIAFTVSVYTDTSCTREFMFITKCDMQNFVADYLFFSLCSKSSLISVNLVY